MSLFSTIRLQPWVFDTIKVPAPHCLSPFWRSFQLISDQPPLGKIPFPIDRFSQSAVEEVTSSVTFCEWKWHQLPAEQQSTIDLVFFARECEKDNSFSPRKV